MEANQASQVNHKNKTMLVSAYKSRIQNKFEGGKSLVVDWYENAKEAGEMLREEITPPSLKRVVPIYGGLIGATDVYYIPEDIDTPSALYNPRNTRQRWEYMPSQVYHLNEDPYKFTIEETNGVKLLLVRHGLVSGTLEVDPFDEVGNKTGVSLEENDLNHLEGSGSLEGTFTDSLTDVEETLDAVLDITDYKRGVALVRINFEDVEKLASVELQLITSSGNLYTMNSTEDSVGDHIKNGWNMVRFDIAKATITGTPVDTSIASYKLVITMNSGESQTVIIDKISLEKNIIYNFEYFSKFLFRDKDDNSWRAVADNDSDIINLGEKEASILVYEGCRLVGFNGKKKSAVPAFDQELTRKYDLYHSRNPSSEQPPMYSEQQKISKRFIIIGQ